MFVVVLLEKVTPWLSYRATWSGGLFKNLETLQQYHESVWSDILTGEPYILEYDFQENCLEGCEPDNYDLVKFLQKNDCPENKSIILKIKGL